MDRTAFEAAFRKAAEDTRAFAARFVNDELSAALRFDFAAAGRAPGSNGQIKFIGGRLLTPDGAEYDEALRRTTTHLVVAPSAVRGPKYETARQWDSVHCVTVDWVYHVMQHDGANMSTDDGRAPDQSPQFMWWEDRFAVAPMTQLS